MKIDSNLASLIERLSHKIRTPLSVINNELTVIEIKVGSEEIELAKKQCSEISKILKEAQGFPAEGVLNRPNKEPQKSNLTSVNQGSNYTSDSNVLLVDDDGDLLISLSRALNASGLNARIQAAGSAKSALSLFHSDRPEAAVIDLSLDDSQGVESGFQLLKKIRVLDPSCRIIVLTGNGSIENGIKALSLGAASFLEKPANIEHLKELLTDGIYQAKIKRAYESISSDEDFISSQLIGNSSAIKELQQEIEFAASNNQSVLLLGETGTGKSLCARLIHSLSNRAEKSLAMYQPNYSNSDLVNSDLFGHTVGAFTGAESSRVGLIKRADSGTFFLDEVDSLPLETQVLLLSVLQEKEYRPIGSDKSISSDFRLISASNANMQTNLANDTLRQDFFHRIAQLEIKIPPLRERLEDVPLFAHYFLKRLCKKEAVNVFSIDDSAIDALMQQSWPGNVRQLESVVVNAAYRAAFAGREVVLIDDFKIVHSAAFLKEKDLNFRERVEAYKLKLIQEALSQTENNQTQAAKFLGLERSTLRRILARTQI